MKEIFFTILTFLNSRCSVSITRDIFHSKSRMVKDDLCSVLNFIFVVAIHFKVKKFGIFPKGRCTDKQISSLECVCLYVTRLSSTHTFSCDWRRRSLWEHKCCRWLKHAATSPWCDAQAREWENTQTHPPSCKALKSVNFCCFSTARSSLKQLFFFFFHWQIWSVLGSNPPITCSDNSLRSRKWNAARKIAAEETDPRR